MLEKGGIFEGMTREQVLFKYERLSSWNLTQHQEVIRRMDSFFGCDGEERIMLTADDAKSLDDVLSNGAIRDVDGTKCIRTTGIDINCGEEAVRHDVRVDCGCDENVPANHAKTEKVSVQARRITALRKFLALQLRLSEKAYRKMQTALVPASKLFRQTTSIAEKLSAKRHLMPSAA